jgi:hypothetical protein
VRIGIVLFAMPITIFAPATASLTEALAEVQAGMASVYSPDSGATTASGEALDLQALTGAQSRIAVRHQGEGGQCKVGRCWS